MSTQIMVDPICKTKLQGGTIRNNMFWKSHLYSAKDSVLKCMNRKIGALMQVTRKLEMKSRIALANGIIISRQVYLIPVWGGAPIDLIR
jgi:hypothetical protein